MLAGQRKATFDAPLDQRSDELSFFMTRRTGGGTIFLTLLRPLARLR
jgi:hypothetical protein